MMSQKNLKMKGEHLRTKKQIVQSYVAALQDKRVITSKQAESLLLASNQNIIMRKLIDKIYATHEVDGQTQSTPEAFYHWCEYIIGSDVVTGKKVWNHFVNTLFKIIEGNKLSAIMAPRGFGKSYFLYALYLSFKLWLVPYVEAVIVCNIPSMGKRNLKVLKRLIDTNEFLQEKKATWKGLRLKWSETMIEFNEGTIEVTSIGSTVRSAHPNICIVDDPLREDNRYPDEYIENFVLGTMLPIINRKKGRMTVVGTPQHERDLFHLVMNTKADGTGNLITRGSMSGRGFYSIVFQAITNWGTEEVLLPELMTYQELMHIRQVQGPRYFDREYMCTARSDEEAVFPWNLLKKRTMDENEKDSDFEEDGREGKQYVIGVDVATSGAVSADNTAIVILEITDEMISEEDGFKKIVRYVYYDKGIDFEEQILLVADLSRRFNDAYVLVEKNNAGPGMINALHHRNVNVGEFFTDQYSKREMIRLLKRNLAVGSLWFCRMVSPIEHLIEELRNFGVKRVRGVERMEAMTGKDDCAIALALANWAAQEGGTSNLYPLLVD